MAQRQEPTADTTQPKQLRQGPFLHCPKCETRREEWDYARLRRVTKYASQTVDVLRCPNCGHVFALPPRGA